MNAAEEWFYIAIAVFAVWFFFGRNRDNETGGVNSPVLKMRSGRIPLRTTSEFPRNPSALSTRQDANYTVRLDYMDSAGKPSQRDVQIRYLLRVTKTKQSYLICWCKLRADYRSFRIDRVTKLLDLKQNKSVSAGIWGYISAVSQ